MNSLKRFPELQICFFLDDSFLLLKITEKESVPSQDHRHNSVNLSLAMVTQRRSKIFN